MACPLFIPSESLGGIAPRNVTLGDLYSGSCEADPSVAIPDETLRQCCNSGYARDRCPRAATHPADAMRFLIKVKNFKGLEIAWSAEQNHHPVEVGVVHLSSLSGQDSDTTVLHQQARAYARAILWQA